MDHNSEQAVDSIETAPKQAHGGPSDLAHIARTFGTPLLVIDEERLRTTLRRFRDAFVHSAWPCEIVYAAKALALKAIFAIVHSEGVALDVCSEGELETALRAGVPAARCLLHGCAKTARELEDAVRSGVGYVVIDHHGEIAALAHAARRASARMPVLVRVNPSVAAATKAQVQTAAAESKFGFPIVDGQALRAVRAVVENLELDFRGIHCHIGSQITDLAAYAIEIERLVAFALQIQRDVAVPCSLINLGGGLGIPQGDDDVDTISPEAWAQVIFSQLERCRSDHPVFQARLMVEPGRAVIARAGTTLYTIAVRKILANGTVALIVDGGMSDNPRPALYEATYPVSVASRRHEPPDGRYTIFGRHCETDLLFRDVALPDPQPGDVLEVRNTGAYTYSMASNYNRFPRPAVALAHGAGARLIARREPLEHLLDLDAMDDQHTGQATA